MWGDGSAFRELMHSDDLADACVYLMNTKDAAQVGELVNVTDGSDIQLCELFETIRTVVGFKGLVEYDTSKPNETPRKLMDSTHMKKLGWMPKIGLSDGIRRYYSWYQSDGADSLCSKAASFTGK
jgi:GDP-L-fucose synthase